MINAASLSLPVDVDWNMISDPTRDQEWKHVNTRKHFVRLEKHNYFPYKRGPIHGFNGHLCSPRGTQTGHTTSHITRL